jgi:hypothetical protein
MATFEKFLHDNPDIAVAVKSVVGCISLFDQACDISSSRPDFAGALRGAAVKGGRRPSRS